ncbi:hypothetical protein KGM_215587 [Danaus plexippus plexippus]|uniref:Uncharacterized protein n=1 Tax=Danaus plexippus plexippus TaxID=278856 RepID=A0A212F6F2_DANPL|nr:hypothetical protein KGM_215587 [Danaus plexippus plexippus]
MVCLQILVLVVSSVLTTVYSIDNDDLNTRAPPKSNAKLIYSVIQRRRHQATHEEIKDDDVGRYFRKSLRTTTVPSIFSMKIENTYQRVHPNERSSDKQIHPKRNHMNADDTGVSSKRSIMNMPIERIAMRTKNLSRRIPFAKRYHPAVTQPITSFNVHHLKEKDDSESTSTTTSTTTTRMSTTPENVVLDTNEKEQTRKNSLADSKNFFPFPARTLGISEDIMAENQNSEELSKLKFMTTTNQPISTTIKKLEESEFVPASIYVPNIISHTRRRRPHFAKKVHSLPIEELRRQQTDTSLNEPHSTSTQGIPSTLNIEKSASPLPMTSPKPPPVPTLSPWYDGFGK